MDDKELIEMLLYRGESDTLDFKLLQYEFENADDDKKSVLLKDILAFANAWRDGPAYILIGVRDGSREVVGLDKDIDDSRLQQFVNGKLNRPLRFSYRSVEHEGHMLGLYTIPVQERPIYAIRAFGKVKADTVYVRRGSSTAEAKPDEIARMGAAPGNAHAPKLQIRLVSLDENATYLQSLEVSILDIAIPDDEDIPNYPEPLQSPFGTRFLAPMFNTNENYYRQLARYIRESRGSVGFKLEVQNIGDSFASDVTIRLAVPSTEGFRLTDRSGLISQPEKNRSFIISQAMTSLNVRKTIAIESGRGIETATFRVGKIRSGEVAMTEELYLVHPAATLSELRITAYSDQLKAPQEQIVPTTIHVERGQFRPGQLKTYVARAKDDE